MSVALYSACLKATASVLLSKHTLERSGIMDCLILFSTSHPYHSIQPIFCFGFFFVQPHCSHCSTSPPHFCAAAFLISSEKGIIHLFGCRWCVLKHNKSQYHLTVSIFLICMHFFFFRFSVLGYAGLSVPKYNDKSATEKKKTAVFYMCLCEYVWGKMSGTEVTTELNWSNHFSHFNNMWSLKSQVLHGRNYPVNTNKLWK